MRSRLWLGSVAVALLLGSSAVPALAKDRERIAARGPVDAETAAKETAELFENVKFHDDIEAAKKAARASGKMILWIHALGELPGDT